MKRNTILFGLAALALFIVLPASAGASAGVSVNTGKILLDSALMPGARYDLPNIEVKNIGDEDADYGMSVEYNEVQSQLKPDAGWFEFNPSAFRLAPGESKIVKVTVTVPAKAMMGDYFAYVEAHTEIQTASGARSSVSGAAATKVYLSVASSSALKAAYYSAQSFVRGHSPWTYGALLIIGLIIIIALAKRIRRFV